MTTLELLRSDATIEAIATHLDSLTHADRVSEVRAFKGRDLRALHELTADRPAPLEHFVPSSVPDGVPVRRRGGELAGGPLCVHSKPAAAAALTLAWCCSAVAAKA